MRKPVHLDAARPPPSPAAGWYLGLLPVGMGLDWEDSGVSQLEPALDWGGQVTQPS